MRAVQGAVAIAKKISDKIFITKVLKSETFKDLRVIRKMFGDVLYNRLDKG